jgi:hypothetical protein
MRGVLSCLLAAAAVSLACLTPVPAAAADGFGRHGFSRPHVRSHRPFVRHGGFRHRFDRFDGHRHRFTFRHRPFRPHTFKHDAFKHAGFKHDWFKHVGFKHRRFEDRDGFKHGFFPSSYLVGQSYPSNVTIVEQGAPAAPVTTGAIPSLADLPVTTGIRNDRPAEPAIYVINPTRRDTTGSIRRGGERSGGAKILTVDPSDAPNVPADVSTGGPRIIHLEVPVGR